MKGSSVTMLFTPYDLGTLTLPNRLVRSATAEILADEEGRPMPRLKSLYRELARGGVGLIITGHMYVHPSGKAHAGMAGIYSDDLVPALAELADVVHAEGGRVAVQINHGGLQCSRRVVSDRLAPSDADSPLLRGSGRETTPDEIEMLIDAYSQAARRVKEAGFDAVQIHGAHGYLVGQFLSPFVNRRTDKWGGDLEGRMRFLRGVCHAVRQQVGCDFPVFIKLGMADAVEGGLTLEHGLQVVAALEGMDLDAVEISGGAGKGYNSRLGVRPGENEGYFRSFARTAKQATQLPCILVGGLRSRSVMEDVLTSEHADAVAVCRPLIREPDWPRSMRSGSIPVASCISCNLCWPKEPEDVGIACRAGRGQDPKEQKG
jgi:2,4-dienoyl-CoA reductase-like NADH-dependent reductase (Old Yellow Enzyme family)